MDRNLNAISLEHAVRIYYIYDIYTMMYIYIYTINKEYKVNIFSK